MGMHAISMAFVKTTSDELKKQTALKKQGK